jgi:rhodanese-related sulfurtransferase
MDSRGSTRISRLPLSAIPALLLPATLSAQTVFEATLGETDPAGAPEISTVEMLGILESGSALVLDVRPHAEWAVGHIPGALNVGPKPGVPISLYTSDAAEIERLAGGDRSRPVVLYCNGPFCGKSKRVASDLLAAGWTDVRRYQLGIPVWRALGGVAVIEAEGARYVRALDRSAVWLDARDPAEFDAGTIAGARNVPASRLLPEKDAGEIRAAKDDGRLPMEDHNARIVVFGRDGEQARILAAAVAREAFHNVSYFDDTWSRLTAALESD